MATPDAGRFSHVTLTVGDLERSVDWYSRVLGARKVADREGDGWTRALMRTDGGLTIGLTVHGVTAAGDAFDHRRVGLDHFSIACAGRSGVEAWRAHLDTLGIEHGPLEEPGYAFVLTARDPDGIAVEFFAPA